MKKELINLEPSIQHLSCKINKNDIAMNKPFKYFLDTLESLKYSIISIKDVDNVIGFGEIVHAIDINGETQGGVIYFESLINYLLSSFKSVSSLADIEEIMKYLRLNIMHNTGLMCGIEQALFDILSQKSDKNLPEILNTNCNKKIFIQITIPIKDNFLNYKKIILTILNKHKPNYVKFKIGIDLELESQAIHYLRSIDTKINISVDANQAFEKAKDALSFLDKISDVNISWAEQLLHKDDLEGMKYLRKNSKVMLMADESVHSSIEAEYLCQNNLVDFLNLKLAKTGGILKALEIIEIANKYNKRVMLGSMLHGKLGIKYNLSFALSQNFITHDFFSYFNVKETKNLNYINKDLSVNANSLLV